MRIKQTLSIIREFTITDFKIRYKGSVLGYFWSLLNPLLMLVTLYVVFSLIVRFDIPHYQLYMLLGIIIWNFLSEATNGSMMSLINKGGFIKKFNFPSETIIISSCLSSFITFFLNFLLFFLFMLFFKVEFSYKILLLPFYLVQLFLLVLGISFFLSALYVKYRDINHIWEFVLLMGFFVSPIVYPLDIIPFEYLRYYLLNPISRIIVDMRYVTLYNYIPDIKNYFITLIVCFAVFAFGYYIFRKRRGSFIEEI